MSYTPATVMDSVSVAVTGLPTASPQPRRHTRTDRIPAAYQSAARTRDRSSRGTAGSPRGPAQRDHRRIARTPPARGRAVAASRRTRHHESSDVLGDLGDD